MQQLVLSLFPGIGLLDRAFEEEGFTVVRGPDLLWGGDIRRFNPPAGRFDGVIGGPPCQAFSRLVNIVRAVHGDGSVAANLIPDYERCVAAADPAWFLMENVEAAPKPVVAGFVVRSLLINNRWFGEAQNRKRRFSFGTRDGRALAPEFAALDSPDWEPAVCSTAGGRRASVALGSNGKPKGKQGGAEKHLLRNRTLAEECELQGLPRDFLEDSPLTAQGKRIVIGNGVPLPMGRAVARAVKRAIELKAAA